MNGISKIVVLSAALLIMIPVLARAGDAETIAEIDRWVAERFEELLAPSMAIAGADGGAVEFEVKEGIKVPFRAGYITGKIKPKVVLRRRKESAVYELFTMGDAMIGVELGVETSGGAGPKLTGGTEGKILLSYQADPKKPGQLTRFLILMICGFNAGTEKIEERVLDALPDGLLDRVAKAAGFAIRTVAHTQANVVGAVGTVLDTLHLPGGGVADNVQNALDRFANKGEALTKFINALDSVPPLQDQVTRFKVGAGPMFKVELDAGAVAGELEVQESVGLERRFLQEDRATGITGLLVLKGKGAAGPNVYAALEGDVGLEIKLLDAEGDRSNKAELVFSGNAKALEGLKIPGLEVGAGPTGSAVYVMTITDPDEAAKSLAQWARLIIDHLHSGHSEQNLFEIFGTLADVTSGKYFLAWGETTKAKVDWKLVNVELNFGRLATKSDVGMNSGDLFQRDN